MYKSDRSVVIACEYAARERVECNLFDRNRKKPTIMPCCSRRVNRKEDLFSYITNEPITFNQLALGSK